MRQHDRVGGVGFLSGEMDATVPLEVTSQVAELYPGSIFIQVPGAGHVSLGWSQCARDRLAESMETLTVADASCGTTPQVIWPAVGRFPLRAHDARPAEVDTGGGNAIGIDERKVVTVAVASATNAMQRFAIGPGTGVGLRGGTFQVDWSEYPAVKLNLSGHSLADDVAVSGTVIWRPGPPALIDWPGDSSFSADLAVEGAGTGGGLLHVEGTWQGSGPVGAFKVTGTLGGRAVAVLVPEA